MSERTTLFSSPRTFEFVGDSFNSSVDINRTTRERNHEINANGGQSIYLSNGGEHAVSSFFA